MENYEKYTHHNEKVWVRKDLKGKHRDYCLCHSCKKLKIGSDDNCEIAKNLYKNCVTFNVVTPVWECPEFSS